MGLQRPELFIGQDTEEDEAMDDPGSLTGLGEDENYLDPWKRSSFCTSSCMDPTMTFQWSLSCK
jgi:hypothetical protein